MSSTAKLEKKREAIQKRLTQTQSQIVKWGSNAVEECEVELVVVELDNLRKKLEALHEDTVISCSSQEFTDDKHESDFETLFSALNKCQVIVMKLVKATSASNPLPSQSFKLDRIKLPQFSGNFSDWQSFHDLFLSSVHKNRSLSGVEKMIHLKACLTGEAASIISSFQATETNYASAWDLVVKRYNNKREIVFSHLKKFDDLKITPGESATGLRQVSDTVNECVRSLKTLKVPVEHWDLILIYYALKKLDTLTRKEWSLDQTLDLPTLDEFIEFLEDRARALADASFGSPQKQSTGSSDKRKSSSSHHVAERPPPTCIKCSDSHFLNQCQAFINLPLEERRKFVNQNQLCFNCFGKNHSAKDCRKKFVCKKCGKKHNNLVHSEFPQSKPTQPSPIPQNKQESPVTAEPEINTHCAGVSSNHVVLLGTLMVTVNSSNGEKTSCRVFMDPGSESHFVSEQCVEKLGLKKQKTFVPIKGIGGVPGDPATGIVNLRLVSNFQKFHLDIQALVLKKITGLMPRVPCKGSWPHLKEVKLSDPSFHQPGQVDILLGAKITASLILPDIIHGPTGSPVAQKTKFGWMLSGEVKATAKGNGSSTSHFVMTPKKLNTESLSIDSPQEENNSICGSNHEPINHNQEDSYEDFSLERFWCIEEPEVKEIPLTVEDEECERHFLSTHIRNKDGGYTVQLPFKPLAMKFGNSRDLALQRFHTINTTESYQEHHP